MAMDLGSSSSYNVETTLRTIFKRCVQCEQGTPSCPRCPSSQICSLVPQSCGECAHMVCIDNPAPVPMSSGPNIGAIAGGVVAGVLVVAIAVSLVWYFWIRKRRAQQDLAEWENEFEQSKTRRPKTGDAASIQTRQSLANSILSRASNIIQIAYIPGVTNRNGESDRISTLGSSPVPPIPAAFRNGGSDTGTPKSPLSHEGDALFFSPDDLRGSTYSTNSSMHSSSRDTQYTRQSITPSLARSSIVSAIYHDDATAEPMPAITGMRILPRMISVKSSTSNTSSQTPAVTPQIGSNQTLLVPGQTAASTSTARNSTGQASAPDTTDIRLQVPSTSSQNKHDSSDASDDDILTDLPDFQGSSLRFHVANPFADPNTSTANRLGPYANMSANISMTAEERARRNNINKLSAVIEEGVKRASRVPSHEGLGGTRITSPFGDEHEVD